MHPMVAQTDFLLLEANDNGYARAVRGKRTRVLCDKEYKSETAEDIRRGGCAVIEFLTANGITKFCVLR